MTTTAIIPAQERIDDMGLVLADIDFRAQLEAVMHDQADAFAASILEVYSADSKLIKCDPHAMAMECMKAATLKLPINKQLGFAYIVPYKDVPQFQLGYKGIIQLALRTGQYRRLNADIVLEGWDVVRNLKTGDVDFEGKPTSGKPQGYFCYFQLLNGFEKICYMTVAECDAHGRKYSAAYKYDISANKKLCPWSTDFNAMALKTTVKKLIGKYGPMSIELADVIAQDAEDILEGAIIEHANIEELPAGPTSEQGTDPSPAAFDPGY